jgi:hypothetical protein
VSWKWGSGCGGSGEAPRGRVVAASSPRKKIALASHTAGTFTWRKRIENTLSCREGGTMMSHLCVE